MNITREWRMYDPRDQRTHPEGTARIEMQFNDDMTIEGLYSRDFGMYSQGGQWLIGSRTLVKWRYMNEKSQDWTPE
jgi:hypothetical protein